MIDFFFAFIFSLGFFVFAALAGPISQWERYSLGLSKNKKEKLNSEILWKKHKYQIFDFAYTLLSILSSVAVGLANVLDYIQPLYKFLICTPLALVTFGLLCWRIHRIWRCANSPDEGDNC